MSAAIDPTITQAPSQGTAGGTSSKNSDLGSFVASIGAVSGALTELLSVVNYTSSKISEYSATMGQAQMAVYETEQQQAQDNLNQALQEAHRKNLFHKAFKAMTSPGGGVHVVTALVNKAFPNSKIAHRLTTALLIVMEPYKELAKILPHEAAKILPDAVNQTFERIHNIATFVPDHGKQYLGDGKQHLEDGAKHVVKWVAEPLYRALYHALKLDPKMSDAEAQAIAHMVADTVVVVAFVVGLTVVTGGAIDALFAEEAGALVAEEASTVVGEAVGDVAGDGFGMEVESTFADDAAASEGTAAGAEATGAQTSAQVNSQIDIERLQKNISRMTQVKQQLRYLQAIMGLIKGMEQFGNAYFDARMAITTKNMGEIQANLKTTQSTLEQVSQINQVNAASLKQTMEDCLSDIKQLYNGLSGIMNSMSQAMYR